MQAAIFDLDGTLLDSMGFWQQQLAQFLQERGITPPDDLLLTTKTLGMELATANFIQRFGLKEDAKAAYRVFQNNMEYYYTHEIPLKLGAEAYLAQLQRNAVPMVIATATARPLVEKVIARFHWQQYFPLFLTVAEVGVGKHDPAIFLCCAQRLNLPPAQCMVFEDSLAAIRAANEAQFQTTAIYEATAPEEQSLLAREAHRYIVDFSELLSS